MPLFPGQSGADGQSSEGPAFRPSKTNIFSAVKAILHPSTNAGVSADDQNHEIDIPGGSSGRDITHLSTLEDQAIGTSSTSLVAAWTSQAGDVANLYDELLIELELGTTFLYGLMPRSRAMLDSRKYKLLTHGQDASAGNAGTDVVLKKFLISFTETNPRQITLELRTGRSVTGGTIRVWGLRYQSATAGVSLEKATDADVDAGTDDEKYMTPVKTARVRNAILGGVSAAGNTLARLYALVTERLTETQVDARIAFWARAGEANPGTAAIATLRGSVAAAGDTLAKLYSLITAVRQLPVYPEAGSRDGKSATFSGDRLLWQDGASDVPPAMLDARVERIDFGSRQASSDGELTPTAISVVNGAGSARDLSGLSGNDFTVAAGVYLVNVHGSFAFSNNNTYAGFALRRSSDDAELDQSNPLFTRSGTELWTARLLLILAADTQLNVLEKISGNVNLTSPHAEFVRLASGGAIRSAHSRYVGWSAAQTPTGAEIVAAASFTADILVIPNPNPDGTLDDDDVPGWLFFAVPDNAGAPPRAYFDGNTHDILGGFTRLGDGVFAGHIVYSTAAEQDPSILGTGSRTLTLEYS